MSQRPENPAYRRETPSHPLLSGHVLHVSDDREAGGIWSFALRQLGLQVTLATSPLEALARIRQDSYDLIVIDVCTPDLDGIELARSLRTELVNPILLFTNDLGEAYILKAYKAGVDECIIKPVSPSLFLAKVRAWMRRTWTVPSSALDVVTANSFKLEPSRRALILEDGDVVKLTNLEFRLLHLLMHHPGQTLLAETIIERVWGYSEGDSTLLKNLVYRLRHKIEPDSSQPLFLRTAPGGGYLFTP